MTTNSSESSRISRLLESHESTTTCRRIPIVDRDSLAGPKGITYSGYTSKGIGIFQMNFRILISKKVRKITLTRSIVSKIVFEEEKVTLVDLLTLYQNQLDLEDLVQRDPNFRKKFGSSLEDLTKILTEARIPRDSVDSNFVLRLKLKLIDQLSEFLIPERNWKHSYKQAMRFVSLLPRKDLGIDLRKFPPKKFIGKGYTDKGTRRDPGYDGSPTWQEVAASDSIKETRNRKKDEIRGTITARP